MSEENEFGFVGLGTMGSLMSARLLEHLGSLAVYDIRPEAVETLEKLGATACSSAAEVGSLAKTVFVSLPMPDVIPPVVRGLLEGGHLQTFIDLSTTGMTVAGEIAALLEPAGVEYLDSPVSGGPNGARNGTLTVMASGKKTVFAELQPLLAKLGSNVVHVGDLPGQGQLTKVINNLLSATALAVTSEAVALGVKGGLDPATLLEVLNTSSGRNSATLDKFPRTVLTRSFDFGFRLALLSKDVNLCMHEANSRKVPMLVGSTVQQLFELAAADMPADADIMDLTRLVERWAGVTIAGEA